MNQKLNLAVLTGLNLVMGTTSASVLVTGDQANTGFNQDAHLTRAMDVLRSDTREFEASFLEVPGTCKGAHAAFDAVAVAIQEVSAEIRAIHAEIEQA